MCRPSHGGHGGTRLEKAQRPRRPAIGSGIQYALRARRDPFGLLEEIAREHGDLARLRVAGRPVFVVNDPQLIREVLMDEGGAFTRASVTAATERLLGGSIVASRGADHDRKKEGSKPIASHGRIEATLAAAVESTGTLTSAWRSGQEIDLHEQMSVLSIRVAAASVLSMKDERAAARLRALLEEAMAAYERTMHPLAPLLDRIPSRETRDVRHATRELHAWVDREVAARLRGTPSDGDALDVLLSARFEDGGPERLTPLELRAIALDFLIASHATLAHVLTWTLHSMAAEPRHQERVAKEAERVPTDRGPAFADLGQLPFARWCFKEGLRLHPPVWIILRRALRATRLGPASVPRGAYLVLSPRLTHRDARYFAGAGRFDPNRWERQPAAPEGGLTYFPFGAGPYGCVGEGLALAQGTLTLALLLRDFSFARVEGPQPKEPAAAMQPPVGVPIRVRARRRGAEPAGGPG